MHTFMLSSSQTRRAQSITQTTDWDFVWFFSPFLIFKVLYYHFFLSVNMCVACQWAPQKWHKPTLLPIHSLHFSVIKRMGLYDATKSRDAALGCYLKPLRPPLWLPSNLEEALNKGLTALFCLCMPFIAHLGSWKQNSTTRAQNQMHDLITKKV